MALQEIITEVNRRAAGRPIGELQDLRKALKGLFRKSSHKIFGHAREGEWTHHIGGRDELQFNLGFETPLDAGDFRFGVAFSLETSQALPTIEPLIPKIARFNDYLRGNTEEFAGLWMWHYESGNRGALTRPIPIDHGLVRPGVFIFLGALGDKSSPNYEIVLDTLDRLLPLYRFVEANDAARRHPALLDPPIRPGCRARPVRTWASLAEKTLAVELRHNVLQTRLYHELVKEFGYEHVAVEHPASSGGRIDVVVRTETTRFLYEIKTASSARDCIREALGQLLDYACWPGGPTVDRVVVVGEPQVTPDVEDFLRTLNQNFPIPLEYRRVALEDD